MSSFASGKKAYFISDRSGFRYPYKDMRREWNGSVVGPDEFEPKHPQLGPFRKVGDSQALKDARPEPKEPTAFIVFSTTGKDIIPSPINDLSVLNTSVGTVTITSTVSSSSSTTASSNIGTSAVGSVAVYQLFIVTVVDDGGNKYFLDGSNQTGSALTLTEGSTYRFDQSHSSNSGHPLRFSTTSNGTHGGGSEYTTGVTTSGTAGNAGAYVQITVAASAPTLYYYCTNHSGMGGQANTP
tara:strand:+ start:793 stop:1512 length:720 start_codon:yes stop_codon:yes gene_type:complete